MPKNGRRAKATAAQRAEVERLHAAGVSVRAIAAQVFDDARFRGRVERILRSPAPPPAEAAAAPAAGGGVAADVADYPALSSSEVIRMLFERRLAELAQATEAPSLTEVRALLDVHRRLETLDAFERIRAVTSEALSSAQ